MTGRIYFILGMTFITGMFTGAYLYVTSFAPSYQQDDIEEVSEIEFRLQGEVYGGCQRTGSCSSFTLENNRRYVFETPAGRMGGEDSKVKGKLDKNMHEDLLLVVESVRWDSLIVRSEKTCSSYIDGNDYRYLLTYQGEQISLDTCGTVFGSSDAAKSFAQLWESLENPTSVNGSDSSFEDMLHERFRGSE